MLYTVFRNPPADFNPTLIAAGCYCEWEGKILLLKRNLNKSLGNTWGVPAGKLEKGESPRSAVVREVFEEIGINFKEEELEEMSPVYVRRTSADVVLHRFWKRFSSRPVITLNLEEHSEVQWLTIPEALALPNITGGVKALDFL